MRAVERPDIAAGGAHEVADRVAPLRGQSRRLALPHLDAAALAQDLPGTGRRSPFDDVDGPMHALLVRDALNNGTDACGVPESRTRDRLHGWQGPRHHKIRTGTEPPEIGRIDTANRLREGRMADKIYYIIGLAAVTAALFTVLGSW